jgi:hypothetical protein
MIEERPGWTKIMQGLGEGYRQEEFRETGETEYLPIANSLFN